MANSIKIPTTQVKALAKALGYRKRNVYVRATEEVTLYDLNWSGGSRNEYYAVRLEDLAAKSAPQMNDKSPWTNHYEGAKVPLVPGMAIAITCQVCGAEGHMTICVHPADMPKMLPAA